MKTLATLAPPGQPRAAAFGFIFATALMNSISFGILIPVLPTLIKRMTAGDTASASVWNAVFATAWGLMQFVCGPVLGMLSDRFGRRPVILVSIFGLFCDFVVLAVAPNLAWLFLGRLVNGATASSFSTAGAYVADITAPDQRAKSFGRLQSAFGFGFLIGPGIGGFLGQYDLRLPFVAAAILCAVNWLYGLFVLPESLPKARRPARVDWSRANPVGSLRFLRGASDLLPMAMVGFLYQFGFTVLPTIFVLYTGFRYGWGLPVIALIFLITGASQIVVQAFLVGPMVKRVGERGAVLLGAAMGSLAFVVYALAPTGLLYLTGIPLFAMSGFLQPGLLGLMSRRVDPSRQGQLQGAVQSLQGVSAFLAPSFFGFTFAWAVRRQASLHLPGLPILAAASLIGGAFVLSLWVAKPPKAQAVAG